MNRSSRIGATVLAAVSISGCLLPEKFETSIVVKPDASYTYKYDGTAVHFLAAMAIKEQGKLAPKDEAAIDADAKKSAKSPGVKKLNYTGNGRYDISILEELMPGQKVKTLQIFNFTKAKDGVYSIVPPGMTAKDLDQLKALDIKVSGKAEVMLPSNAKVGGCAEFCVNGQSTAGESLLVRKHNDNQEARSTARTAGQPAGRLQEA